MQWVAQRHDINRHSLRPVGDSFAWLWQPGRLPHGKQMKAEASAAEAKFEKLTKAGTESWTAWNAALTESRTAFDRANEAAWESFKRASSEA
jgi:hypothetical protein